MRNARARVNVIYSESIINLLSVARSEQHRSRRVTCMCLRERKAAGREVEEHRKRDVCICGAMRSGVERKNGTAPRQRLWQENNPRPSVFK